MLNGRGHHFSFTVGAKRSEKKLMAILGAFLSCKKTYIGVFTQTAQLTPPETGNLRNLNSYHP